MKRLNLLLIFTLILVLISCSDSGTETDKKNPAEYKNQLMAHNSQVEWWYYFGFAEGRSTGREYGIMASFFTFKATEDSPTGHYVIHEVIDLETGRHFTSSKADSAFLNTMGTVSELIYTMMLQRKPTAAEQAYIDTLKSAQAPFRHSKFDVPELSGWPLYIDYAGDKFSISQSAMHFASKVAGDEYDFDIVMEPTAEIVPVMGSGMISDVMHYYTFPEMELTGTINIEGTAENIEGRAWFDHQWQDFGGDVASISDGWRWAGVMLDGGPYIHLYQFHNIFSKQLTGNGFMTLSYPDGRKQTVLEDVQYSELKEWTSPATGVTYPISSRWVSPSGNISIELIPRADEQEMFTLTPLNPSIWEGACNAVVVIDGDTLRGMAFQELNGFAEVK